MLAEPQRLQARTPPVGCLGAATNQQTGDAAKGVTPASEIINAQQRYLGSQERRRVRGSTVPHRPISAGPRLARLLPKPPISWSARRHALSEAECLCPRSAVRSRPRGMTGRERAARTRTSTALRRADCGPPGATRHHYTVGEAGCLCAQDALTEVVDRTRPCVAYLPHDPTTPAFFSQSSAPSRQTSAP